MHVATSGRKLPIHYGEVKLRKIVGEREKRNKKLLVCTGNENDFTGAKTVPRN